MSEKALEFRVKECIINRLNLEVNPEEIDDNAPIFSLGNNELSAVSEETVEKKSLELDSIDALEMVVALNNEFNIEITENDMAIFQSVKTIADFIREKTGE